MRCTVRNLSVLAYAQGFTLWHYKAMPDAPARLPNLVDDAGFVRTAQAVTAPGYFDPAGDLLAQGDMVLVSAPDQGMLLFVTGTGERVRTAPLAG